MKRVMGLDISTTTIGIMILEFSQFDDKIKIVHRSFFKPDKKKSEIDKIIEAKQHVLALAQEHGVDMFAVEEFIKFMKGQSGAKTIIPLALINRAICIGIKEKFGVDPRIINIMKIRHTIKLDSSIPAKEDIPEILNVRINAGFPLFFNKKNKPSVENYDVADAGSCAYCCIEMYRQETNDTKKDNKRKKRNKGRGKMRSVR